MEIEAPTVINFQGDHNQHEVEQIVELLEKKLKYRLYGFLKFRLPLQRSDLLSGRHWV